LKAIETTLPGVLLIEPDVFGDARGFFMETYHVAKFRELGIDAEFVQDNHSRSARGVLRGLHFQEPNPQGKIVRCPRGAIYDVAVDVRRGSPHFGRWVGVTLSGENLLQCYITPGFAHGFCVVSPNALVEYKCTDVYDPASELGIAWNDGSLGIRWPVTDPILSDRDRGNPSLAAVIDRLPPFTNL